MNEQDLLNFIKQYERLIHKKTAFYYKNYTVLSDYYDYEDLYSMAIEQIIKSSKYFKPELGYDFSTYSLTSVENSFKMAIRKRCNQLKYISIEQSLDEPIKDKNDNDMSYHDYIKDDFSKSVEDRVIDSIKLEKAMEKIKSYKNMYEVLHLYSQGYSTTEISKVIGVTQSMVSRKIIKARQIIKELI